jgi:uncharacterized protein
MRLNYLFFACLILIAASLRSQIYTPQSVPNSRLIDIHNHIVDPNVLVNKEAADSINHMLSLLESNTTSEVAVVVLESIGEADVFDFAQTLFND